MPVIRPFLLISGLLWLLVACRPAANAPYIAYPYPAAGSEADPAGWSQCHGQQRGAHGWRRLRRA